MPPSRMRRAVELGTGFWSASCSLGAIRRALPHGATGAVCDAWLVARAVLEERKTWVPLLDGILELDPRASDADAAWKLYCSIAAGAAAILESTHRRTGGAQGLVSVQVDPSFAGDHHAMVARAEALAASAPNFVIGIPCTPAGLAAIEELSARDFRLDAAACWSVSQALAADEAMECGRLRARSRRPPDPAETPPTCFVTMDLKGIEGAVRGTVARLGTGVEPSAIEWAPVAVFKRARALLRERGCRSALSASCGGSRLWTELVGGDAVLRLPPEEWARFNESAAPVERALVRPVDPSVLAELQKAEVFPKLYEPGRLEDGELDSLSKAALALPLEGRTALLDLVRGRRKKA